MSNYLLYRIGQRIALSLPLKLAYALGVFISDINYIFARKDRKSVKENLRVIFPEKPENEIRVLGRRMSRNFAKYLVDFFRFPMMDAGYIKKNVKAENFQYLDEAIAKGKGVIILSAHIGNWEMGGIAIAQMGYPLWVVALPHKNKKVNDFFISQREDKSVKVIQLGMAVRKCFEVFKRNEILALVGDRDFTDDGIVLEFFGKPSVFPEGPAAFSLKTGAIIVPGFMFRNRDDTFTLRMEKPIEFNPGSDRKNDIRNLISLYKPLIEDYIRRYPDQWFMFRRFWVEKI
ncbi:MAG TPA: lysophospholipid acyltransferase family protein [Candidatus Margulisiibacteriota bacterium]|nr:lysophospholipid acyltransferase family protein [Candidatus Margulisiibacteriota bacterium]